MAEQSAKRNETQCHSTMPIAVQACLRIRMFVLHFCTGSTYALDRMSECHGDQGWSRVTREAPQGHFVTSFGRTRMCESGQTVAMATVFAPERRLRSRILSLLP